MNSIPCLSTNGVTTYRLPTPPLRLMVGTVDGVVSLTRPDASGAWRVDRRSLEGKYISAMVGVPSGELFASVHGGGIHRSADGGATWQPVVSGLTNQNVFSLSMVEEPSGVALYAGTEPVSLFRSRDLGEHWDELPAIARMPGRENWCFPPPPHEAHTKALIGDSRNPQCLYAAVEQGALLRSKDGGDSWTELDDYGRHEGMLDRDVHRIVQAPWNPDLMFLATGRSCYRSTDAGAHWNPIPQLQGEIGYADGIVASPNGDRTVLISGAQGNPGDWFKTGRADGTVFRSRDEGKSWEPANEGLPPRGQANVEAMTLVSWPDGVAVFIGDTDGRVYMSDDLGGHWSTVATGLPPISKTGHHKILGIAGSVPRILRPVFAEASTMAIEFSMSRAAARRKKLATAHP